VGVEEVFYEDDLYGAYDNGKKILRDIFIRISTRSQ
jgi:hypothetical protein